MTTLPQMGLVLPTRGAVGSGQWSDTLDANYAKEDAHDHTPGKGTLVPTAGLNINADLTFSGLYAPTNLARMSFSEVAVPTGHNKSLYVKSDHELYWLSNAGAEVKLTNGAALNVAAFTGGIGGDYAAVGAAVAFDDANDRYTFKQQGGVWARMASGEMRILETGSSETVFVGLAAPAALASSYSITLPLAAPGSTSFVQMDSSGVLTASNTMTNAVAFNSTCTVGSTFGSFGVIAAHAGMTCDANQNVIVSGTGRFKHGSIEFPLAISSYSVDGASTYASFNQSGYITGFGGACSCQATINLPVGKRIVSVQQFYNVNSTGAAIQPFIKKIVLSTGVVSALSTGSSDNTGAALESQTMSPGYTTVTGEAYWIQVNVSNAGHQVHGAIVILDDP